jgi:AcrR family transcriptional regulator
MRGQSSVQARAPAARRKSDRRDTRQRLLDTAGEVFAEKGLDSATGLEICARAQVNGAAINYYFGGMEGLYEAVLIEARDRLPRLSDLSAIMSGRADARDKLRAVIEMAVAALSGPDSRTWVPRLLLRESASPSPAFRRLLLEAEGLPKLRLLRGMIAEIMLLPDDHPAVSHAGLSVLAPCQVLVMLDHKLLRQVYPDLDMAKGGAAQLADHLTTFALGGLASLAALAGSAKRAGNA